MHYLKHIYTKQLFTVYELLLFIIHWNENSGSLGVLYFC